MSELDSLLERPDYGHEDSQLWACANCGAARTSSAAILIGGLIVCRDFEACAVVALRLARAARPAAAPPPRIVLRRAPRSRAPEPAPAPRPQRPLSSAAPRLPYNAPRPAAPTAEAIAMLVTLRQRSRKGRP